MTTKICKTCSLDLPIDDFAITPYMRSSKLHTYTKHSCIKCEKIKVDERRYKLIKHRIETRVFIEEKTCRCCNVTKPKYDYTINTRTIDGLCMYCKQCSKIPKAKRIKIDYNTFDGWRHAILQRAKSRAKQKGWDFNIELEDIIVPEVCPVLGIPLRIANDLRQHDSPSLDRLDPKKGYVKGNVKVTSWLANRLKSGCTDSSYFRKIADYIDSQKSS